MLVLEDSHHGCQAGVASGAVTIAIPGSHNGSKPYCDVHACVSTLHDPQVFELLACGLPV
jgi:beta-phosphoglucomutase-like phosphatase (HAD superfamily)